MEVQCIVAAVAATKTCIPQLWLTVCDEVENTSCNWGRHTD